MFSIQMKAVILVGGLGTRLRPLSINTPKAMMPVVNVPFLEYVIRRLIRHNVDHIVLAISHLPQPIRDFLGDGSRFGIRIDYTVEEKALGTAGAVKNAAEFLDGNPFLTLNGDIFTDLDITEMVTLHKQRKAMISIALTPVDDPSSYGLIETDKDGRIRRFLEKPKPQEITTNMINAGTYILEPEVLDCIPPDTNFSFERDVFPPLLQQGKPVYACPSDCYWMDIGTPQKYHQLNRDLLSGRSNQYDSGRCGQIVSGAGSTLHPSAKIIQPVVIGEGCNIGKNTIIEDSVIWNNVCIEAGAVIRRCIIADNCNIGADSILEDAVIADNVNVAAGYRAEAGVKAWPGTRLG